VAIELYPQNPAFGPVWALEFTSLSTGPIEVEGGELFDTRYADKIHLAGMFGLEGTDLEVKGNERLQETVVEKQVDEVLLATDGQPMLPSYEAKAVPELKDERLQRIDQPGFEFPLLKGVCDAKEFEIVAALEDLICSLGQWLWQGKLKVMSLLLLDSAFVSRRFDLIEQHIAAPAEMCCRAQVIQPGRRVENPRKRVGVMTTRNARR
jgi:hypothetical protein